MTSPMRMTDLFVMLPFTLSFSGRIIRFIIEDGRWKDGYPDENSCRDSRDVCRWYRRREAG